MYIVQGSYLQDITIIHYGKKCHFHRQN